MKSWKYRDQETGIEIVVPLEQLATDHLVKALRYAGRKASEAQQGLLFWGDAAQSLRDELDRRGL